MQGGAPSSLHQAVAPGSPTSIFVSTRVPTLSSRKRGFPGSLDQAPLEELQARVGAEQGLEEGGGLCGRQGVNAQLRIIGLPTPMVLILRPIADEQEKLGARQTLDQRVEDALSSGVEPVEILKDEEEGLESDSPTAVDASPHPGSAGGAEQDRGPATVGPRPTRPAMPARVAASARGSPPTRAASWSASPGICSGSS